MQFNNEINRNVEQTTNTRTQSWLRHLFQMQSLITKAQYRWFIFNQNKGSAEKKCFLKYVKCFIISEIFYVLRIGRKNAS